MSNVGASAKMIDVPTEIFAYLIEFIAGVIKPDLTMPPNLRHS